MLVVPLLASAGGGQAGAPLFSATITPYDVQIAVVPFGLGESPKDRSAGRADAGVAVVFSPFSFVLPPGGGWVGLNAAAGGPPTVLDRKGMTLIVPIAR